MLEAKSVRKRFKEKSFAASVNREEVHRGMEELGVDPTEHIQFLIDALRPIAQEIGLQGEVPQEATPRS